MKTALLGLALLLTTACESAPKKGSEPSATEQTGTREKKTTFGRAVQSARDVDSSSKARNEEMEKQLHDVTE